MIETIRAQRAALAAAIDQAKAQYEGVERMLLDLRRSIDMQVGGLKELDALIALCDCTRCGHGRPLTAVTDQATAIARDMLCP